MKRQLEMTALTSRDLNGIEMGVFADGAPFLTGRGLAALCGVAPSVINQWANDYDADSTKPRDVAITRLIEAQSYQGDELFYKTTIVTKIGTKDEVNAYPEAVCMAVLEYYAFEADRRSEGALRNYRILARAGLRAFVYSALGYDPTRQLSDPFRSFHERLMLNVLPPRVYSCFTETAHVVLAAIRAGLIVDQHTVPDISVGQYWSKYWVANDLDDEFGERTRHPHVYPDDYAQSVVTPEAFTYPIDSLPRFRRWLDEEYLPSKYPAYIKRKVKDGALPASRAELLIESIVPKALASAGS
jgi:hypothetical protein